MVGGGIAIAVTECAGSKRRPPASVAVGEMLQYTQPPYIQLAITHSPTTLLVPLRAPPGMSLGPGPIQPLLHVRRGSNAGCQAVVSYWQLTTAALNLCATARCVWVFEGALQGCGKRRVWCGKVDTSCHRAAQCMHQSTHSQHTNQTPINTPINTKSTPIKPMPTLSILLPILDGIQQQLRVLYAEAHCKRLGGHGHPQVS